MNETIRIRKSAGHWLLVAGRAYYRSTTMFTLLLATPLDTSATGYQQRTGCGPSVCACVSKLREQVRMIFGAEQFVPRTHYYTKRISGELTSAISSLLPWTCHSLETRVHWEHLGSTSFLAFTLKQCSWHTQKPCQAVSQSMRSGDYGDMHLIQNKTHCQCDHFCFL